MTTAHCAPVVVPIVGEPLRDAAVLVEGDRIAGVVPQGEVPADVRRREWHGVLTPGLVNAHAHLQYTDFADLATSGLPFPQWIRTLTERRRTYTPQMWQASTRHGLFRMFQTGTTCVADIVTNAEVLLPTARSGVAGVSYVEVVGVDEARWPDECAALYAALDGAPAGRRLGVSPHALYSLGSKVCERVGAIGRERGLRLHPHAAETEDEAEFVLAGTGVFAEMNARFGLDHELLHAGGSGRSPVHELDALGLLGPDVHVAHGVHVDAADRALLRERRTAVALCARSNAILGAGAAPVAAYLAEGNPVAVGTDSLASSPSLDLLAELRALRDLARAQGADPDGLDRRLVEAATVGGATAMGLAGECGVLVPGGRADLAVFDVPTEGSPYAALVEHGGGRCVGTVLGGRIVHRS